MGKTRRLEVRKVVVEIDLARYSQIAGQLEPRRGATAVGLVNQQVQALVRKALRPLGLAAAQAVLKTTGDGAILSFDEADAACQFAENLQRGAHAHNRDKDDELAQRHFRVGVASGPIALATETAETGRFVGFDFAGTTVCKAERLMSACRTGEILICSETWALLSAEQQQLYGAEEQLAGKEHDKSCPAHRRRAVEPARWEEAAIADAAGAAPAPEAAGQAPTVTAARPAPLSQLPAAPGDFVGRKEELARLKRAAEAGAATVVIRGPPGSGKTALALRLAEQLAAHCAGAQFYENMLGARAPGRAPAEVLRHIVHSLHPDAKLPAQDGDLRTLYQSLLKDRRALLLMDDVRDVEQLKPLLPPSCLLIVTARQALDVEGAFALELAELSKAESSELLLRIAPRLATPVSAGARAGARAVDVLTELCDGQPLTLRLVGSTLAADRSLKAAQYIGLLRKRCPHAAAGAESVLALGYDLLPAARQRLWRALAVFPEGFDADAAAAVWKLAAAEAAAVLDALVGGGLVQLVAFRPQAGGEKHFPAGGRYSLHESARTFAEAKLTAAERHEAGWRQAAHFLEILRKANALYAAGRRSAPAGLALLDKEWPNIRASHAWTEGQAATLPEAASLCAEYPAAGGECLQSRQDPREHTRWWEAAVAAVPGQQGAPGAAARLAGLGRAYARLGEMQRAVELHEAALAAARAGGERGSEAAALDWLGAACTELQQTQRALELRQQQLAVVRDLQDRCAESRVLTKLGRTHATLGDSQRAVEMLEHALAVAREIGDQGAEGEALTSLGDTHAQLGEVRRASEFYEQALRVTRHIGLPRGN